MQLTALSAGQQGNPLPGHQTSTSSSKSISLPPWDQKRSCSPALPHKWEGFWHSAGCHGINPNSAIHTALVSWTAKWVTDSLREEFCNPSKKKKLCWLWTFAFWCWEFGAVEKSNWLFGPWKRKYSNRTLVNGPWVWMKTSVTWATRALFFFRHGNMKHQRERTSGTECLIVS